MQNVQNVINLKKSFLGLVGFVDFQKKWGCCMETPVTSEPIVVEGWLKICASDWTTIYLLGVRV